MLNVIIAILVSALILGIVWNQLITSISFKIVDDTTDIKKPLLEYLIGQSMKML